MLPVVAIVGRPNTGKSTLFNKLIGRRFAIESDIPGTTRDRIYQKITMRDQELVLVDTGGLSINTEDETLENDVQSQAHIAIDEADVVLFVIDVRQELTADDFHAANILRKSGKSTLLIANKCDSVNLEEKSFNVYELGFGEPIKISALQGIGLEQIESMVSKKLFKLGFSHQKEKTPMKGISIALLGKQNVGKSSLVNAFLDEKKAIVSEIPGTTRDAVDTFIEYEGQQFTLIDTAGLRRRGKIGKGLEHFSVLRSLQAVERCDTALLILDYHEGLTKQDLRVSHYILESGKGLIIVVNKCDLMEDAEEEQARFLAKLKRNMAYVPWAPVIFVSAITKKNMYKILDLVREIDLERKKRLQTAEFNAFVEKMKYRSVPTGPSRVKPKIYYASQVSTDPPHFVFFVNDRDSFHFSYKRYLENRIREKYGFTGTAIRMDFRNRKKQ